MFPAANFSQADNSSSHGDALLQVVKQLEDLCASAFPGDRIPGRAKLMQLCDASDRTVVRALEELERRGHISRGAGSGVFVVSGKSEPGGDDGATEGAQPVQQILVAIAPRDEAFYDRCVSVLARLANDVDLPFMYRSLGGDAPDFKVLPPRPDAPMGYAVFGWPNEPLARALQEAGHPVVLIGAVPMGESSTVPHVSGDQEYGGYLAASHLLGLGHTHLLFQGGDNFELSVRWRGCQRAVQQAQLRGGAGATGMSQRITNEWVEDPDSARQFFEQPDAPTAILAWNDHEAVVLLTLLSRAGLRVPEDISLVGFDNLPEAQQVHPPITTVDHGLQEQMRTVLGLLTGELPILRSRHLQVVPTLLARGSSAAVKSKPSVSK